MDQSDKFKKAEDFTLLLLRLVAALLFMQVGGLKLFGWFGGMPGGGSPPVGTQIWFAGVLEVFGGAAIFLGLCTRPIAFILSGEMAIAYFQAHQPQGTWPIQNHGEQAVLYCFLFLYLAARGAGQFSLDHMLKSRRGTS